ncbi:hypothetical protein HPP92_009534 [Vanilla planifolia]|uniref:LOB domain-containing protein n=1 Tax=Vanilla planifolia TaxID=51239 RepID=A0A835V6E6_VANPL|nr:hypothetical protein HPP92_009534 [Vanilla planifolia]
MSCNGCRVLRKGCSDSCILRSCLQWIETPEAQGHATVFVAKFFGRAGLMSFLSAVPDSHRPALFQSLLFEACGRTINPVHGAVGLLWTGNWHLCQAAADTVLRGGVLRPMAVFPGFDTGDEPDERISWPCFSAAKRRKVLPAVDRAPPRRDLHLCYTSRSLIQKDKVRPTTPSMNSEESVTTSADSCSDRQPTLLNLFR